MIRHICLICLIPVKTIARSKPPLPHQALYLRITQNAKRTSHNKFIPSYLLTSFYIIPNLLLPGNHFFFT